MLTWTPDIGLLKALIAMNDGKTDIVLTPATAEIRPGDAVDGPPPPLVF
ncbi:hypothetical protein DFJ67_5729 [Asanoa ferruginea]|uniref:Uncharacterized protein n=1 Tax=Asanoa ferruginea TaxID=53367 RepID=A0A3D9ZS30_9ACTN|nr:hypothetical protein [Asanoa ferruginea]REF99689.1 hypothetical protein DFJ67_5729 [Asanoa ferruginea]GIF50398.1 hypothetical protein Afe04nite_49370 [Asanoa ferruginea]